MSGVEQPSSSWSGQAAIVEWNLRSGQTSGAKPHRAGRKDDGGTILTLREKIAKERDELKILGSPLPNSGIQ